MKNDTLDFKKSIYEQFARIGKAISSPKRLELLDILLQGERSVEVLANETKMTMGNTSQHLQVLREARIIESEKKGMYVIYRLSNNSVIEFLNSLHKVAEESFLEIEYIKNKFLKENKEYEEIDSNELSNRILSGSVLLIDVRPIEEYNFSHIEGAISIPINELENQICNLPKDKDIVAYCRGKYCISSKKAVDELRKKGFNAIRFKESVQDWILKELPVIYSNN